MKKFSTRSVALTGMLFALAIVLSFAEGMLTPIFCLPPGVKLGLSNIVVMFALFYIGKPQAVLLAVLKGGFAMLTRGFIAGVLSLSGGLFSCLILILLTYLPFKISLLIFSVTGAVAHNIGQLIALSFVVTGSAYTVYYLPVLLISGVVMGSITSISLNAVMPALKKLGIYKEK
ncbi:MAG: Gx transporter family protein [Oscillospiraceae bacterium]